MSNKFKFKWKLKNNEHGFDGCFCLGVNGKMKEFYILVNDAGAIDKRFLSVYSEEDDEVYTVAIEKDDDFASVDVTSAGIEVLVFFLKTDNYNSYDAAFAAVK